jgi:hypothetical protein
MSTNYSPARDEALEQVENAHDGALLRIIAKYLVLIYFK